MPRKSKKNLSADETGLIAGEGCVCPTSFVITGDSTATKIRLGKKDAALAYAQAKKRGMPCNDYLKLILHSALQKDGAESATS